MIYTTKAEKLQQEFLNFISLHYFNLSVISIKIFSIKKFMNLFASISKFSYLTTLRGTGTLRFDCKKHYQIEHSLHEIVTKPY